MEGFVRENKPGGRYKHSAEAVGLLHQLEVPLHHFKLARKCCS